MKPGWYVQIIETASGKVVNEMGPHTQSRSEKIERGASINLDHDRFYTHSFEVINIKKTCGQ